MLHLVSEIVQVVLSRAKVILPAILYLDVDHISASVDVEGEDLVPDGLSDLRETSIGSASLAFGLHQYHITCVRIGKTAGLHKLRTQNTVDHDPILVDLLLHHIFQLVSYLFPLRLILLHVPLKLLDPLLALDHLYEVAVHELLEANKVRPVLIQLLKDRCHDVKVEYLRVFITLLVLGCLMKTVKESFIFKFKSMRAPITHVVLTLDSKNCSISSMVTIPSRLTSRTENSWISCYLTFSSSLSLDS